MRRHSSKSCIFEQIFSLRFFYLFVTLGIKDNAYVFHVLELNCYPRNINENLRQGSYFYRKYHPSSERYLEDLNQGLISSNVWHATRHLKALCPKNLDLKENLPSGLPMVNHNCFSTSLFNNR